MVGKEGRDRIRTTKKQTTRVTGREYNIYEEQIRSGTGTRGNREAQALRRKEGLVRAREITRITCKRRAGYGRAEPTRAEQSRADQRIDEARREYEEWGETASDGRINTRREDNTREGER